MAGRSVLELILRIKKQGDAKSVNKDLKSIAVTMGAVTAAALAAKKAFDFAQEGASIKRLEESGARLASSLGQNMDDIIASMQSASNNTLNASDAMLAANQALLLGVAQTPQEFEDLTKASIALGRAMGIDTKRAIESITIGIGRMSPKWLDNLGVVFNAETVYKDYAATIGKTEDALTDLDKKRALLNVTLKSGNALLDEHGNLIGDTADAYEQLTAASQDAMAQIKKELGEAIEPAAKGMAEWLAWINENGRARAVLQRAGVSYLRGLFMERDAMLELADAYQGLGGKTEHEARMLGLVTEEAAKVPPDVPIHVEVFGEEDAIGVFDKLLAKLHLMQFLGGINLNVKGIGGFGSTGNQFVELGRRGGGRLSLFSKLVGPGFANGGEITIPPGFPNDSFPIRASSGETVYTDNRQFNINMPDGGPDIVDALARRIRRL